MKESINQTYRIGSVISKDGTIIGYRQFGKGPGVILLHGGMMASQNFMKFSTALSRYYTVYVPDRRGRGLSGPFGDDYTPGKDIEDIQALVAKIGARNLFGLSSGAIIALNSALAIPAIQKLAVYEPPLLVPGLSTIDWAARYEKELAEGKLADAMISVMKGTADESLFKLVPRFLLSPLMKAAIAEDEKKIKGNDVPLKTLIATMHYDIMIVRASQGVLDKCKNLHADLLLLGGTKSNSFLKATLGVLQESMPGAKRTTFKGVGHIAADNNGKPEMVANELIRFFG